MISTFLSRLKGPQAKATLQALVEQRSGLQFLKPPKLVLLPLDQILFSKEKIAGSVAVTTTRRQQLGLG